MAAAERTCERNGRIITTAIVWLLMGAIVNVAVARGISLLGSPRHWWTPSRTYIPGDGSTWNVALGWSPGTTIVFGEPLPVPSERWISRDPPKWSVTVTDPSPRQLREINSLVEEARGWPMRALLGRVVEVRTGQIQFAGSIQLPWEADRGKRARTLPLIPLWPGFAINTVFYAVLLWLLFAAPFALRKRLHKRSLTAA